MKARWLIGLVAWMTLIGCGVPERPVANTARPSGTPAQQAEQTQLYLQALAAGEPEVTVYGAATDREVDALWQAFGERFPGLRVTYLHVSPHQLMPRVDAETVAGVHFADLCLQPLTMAPRIAQSGYLQPFEPLTAEGLPAQYRSDDGLLHYPFNKLFGLAFNTQQVDETQLPQHFSALLQPTWNKRFSYMAPPSISGVTDVSVATLLMDGRADYDALQLLARNGINTNLDNGVTYLAQGRQSLNIWAYLPSILRMRELGAPVDIRFIADFSVELPFAVGLIRHAPHPNAARLLKSWLLSPDGQQILAERAYMLGNMPDAPSPPRYPTGEARQALLQRPLPGPLQVQMDQQRDQLRQIFRKNR
ncbi:ABC transporter substrate-binding protein [Pseudomonas sp. LRF_L74]|uniref:ABC transporter substrate-binding protein n=1 Tax=Pseudomonas sp. LRF_L74 TaxID=3369422 RepID=UPI003F6140FD